MRAADVSRKHFGRGLTDESAYVLDGFADGHIHYPAAATDLITAADLTRKYSQELHANEIMLLAYYIAAVNIESPTMLWRARPPTPTPMSRSRDGAAD